MEMTDNDDTPNKIIAENEECVDSIELQMCKKVTIETKGGTIKLFQKTIQITIDKGHGSEIVEYTPGDYPQPCSPSALTNVEIFSKGLFIIVRVFAQFNPFKPMFEVR